MNWLIKLLIGKKQLAKIEQATSGFSAGKITETEFMRIVWSDYPY